MVRAILPSLSRDRILTALIWIVLLGTAWSLPVISLIETSRERARVESGHYYTPKMPPEWYVQRQ